ncbi:hypothetical protein V8Z80_13735 [Orrella sp. JC864]|uniref:hypothetical protein n=1 Tax=Orrella sp. JC864 TaxID=3120298 RepID=UPI0030085A26
MRGTLLTGTERAILWGGIAAGLAFAACMSYLMEKETDSSIWVHVLIWGVTLFGTAMAVGSYLPDPEERRGRAMQEAGQARHVQGRIASVRHRGLRETERIRQTRLAITAIMPLEDGTERMVELDVLVEDSLLPRFSTGQHIDLMHDPDDPDFVSIDRSRSPVMVQ